MTKKENKVSNNAQKVETQNDNQEIRVPQFISLESTIGAIALLAARSQTHKYLFMSDLEWLVLPPVSQKQFTLFRSKKNEPIAFVSWAKISADVEKRLLSGQTKLQPQDWNSGDKTYIMDVISPFAQGKEVLKQLQENQLKGQKVSILRPSKEKNGLESLSLEIFLQDNKVEAIEAEKKKVN